MAGPKVSIKRFYIMYCKDTNKIIHLTCSHTRYYSLAALPNPICGLDSNTIIIICAGVEESECSSAEIIPAAVGADYLPLECCSFPVSQSVDKQNVIA